MRKTHARIIVVGIVLAGVMLFAKRSKGWPKYSESRMAMGTFVTVEVCQPSINEQQLSGIFGQVWAAIDTIEGKMSVYEPQSDVSRINSAGNDPVEVSAQTLEVLHAAQHFHQLTKGAFDITVGPLIGLWKDAQKKDTLPEEEHIRAVRKYVGMDQLELSGHTVRKGSRQARIALGAIAKGYAVDVAAGILSDHQIGKLSNQCGWRLIRSGAELLTKPVAHRHTQPEEQDREH
jgi:thiamine biosynthesis lipoprotein